LRVDIISFKYAGVFEIIKYSVVKEAKRSVLRKKLAKIKYIALLLMNDLLFEKNFMNNPSESERYVSPFKVRSVGKNRFLEKLNARVF
jgi:hypothetical protein